MESFQSGAKSIGIDVVEPLGRGPFPAMLLLHGSGGNIRFWLDRLSPHAARLGVAIYAVHYFERTGTQRAHAATILDGYHFPLWLDAIYDALTFIAARPRIDSRRIVLFGISLGAFLALAAAADNRANPSIRAIVEISGGLPDAYAASLTPTFPPTLILHGEADTVVPVRLARDLDAHLTRLGSPHQLLLFPGEGHWFSPAAQMQILLAIATFLFTWISPTIAPQASRPKS